MNLDCLIADSVGPSRIAFKALSVEARNAFKHEILPQIETISSARDLSRIVSEVTAAVQEAGRAKDTLYTRLIRHKSIDQVDDSFFADIVSVLNQWGTDTLKKLKEGDEGVAVLEDKAPRIEPNADPISALRGEIENELGPAANLTPWDLARSLQRVFKQRGVRMANARMASRDHVAVSFDLWGVNEMMFQYRDGLGWSTSIGLGPKTAAQEIMVRMAKAG